MSRERGDRSTGRVHRVPVRSLRHGHTPDGRRQNRGKGRGGGPIHYNRRGEVTDGMKRLRDARARGDRDIAAVYAPDSEVAPCCFRELVCGRRRLAIRLAQRWIKIQVGWLPDRLVPT